MLTRDAAIKTAKKFVEDCEKQNMRFSHVYIFGSAVNDSRNEDSDIDLLLVSNQFTYNKWENALLLAPVNKNYTKIDAHIFPTEYFLNGDPFINEVVRQGVKII